MTQNNTARLLSLDVFRGMTVALMIIVNNPGDWGHIYPPLEHAEWNGCTPTDWVFPFFLFIVGVATTLSLNHKKEAHKTHTQIILSVLKRSIIIFLLGFFTMYYPKFNLETVRIMGVLQRIGIVYGIVAILFLKVSWRTILALFIGITVFYTWGITHLPDYSKGYVNLLEKDANFGAYLDRLVFTEKHLWAQSKTWDPEGLFSTISAVATALLGVLVGYILQLKSVHIAQKMGYLIAVGTLSLIAGLALDKWYLPLNKSLWTSSYVLYTGGLATLILSFLYYVIDIVGIKTIFKPFAWYGVNAMLVFFGSAIIAKTLYFFKTPSPKDPEKTVSYATYFYTYIIKPYFEEPLHASLAHALFWLLCWGAVLGIMYWQKWIWKV